MSEVVPVEKANGSSHRSTAPGAGAGSSPKADAAIRGHGHWTQVQMREPKEGPLDGQGKGRAKGRTGDFNAGAGSTADELGGPRENVLGASGQVGYQVLDVDDVSTKKKSGAVGYGPDGAAAMVGRERTLDAVSGEKMTTSDTARYDHDKRRVTVGRTEKVSREQDGKTIDSERGTTIAVGKDGLELGHDRKSTVVDADGVTTAKSLGLSGNVTEGEVGVKGSRSRSEADTGASRSVSGSASVKVGKHGLEKASAQASVSLGSLTINLDGGFSFIVEEPQMVERDGKRVWSMRVTRTVTSGSGVTVKGVGGGMKDTSTQVMTIIRDSREALIAMRTRGRLEAELAKPADARTVRDMRDGESRSSGKSEDGSLSGEAWMGVMQVGASFTNGKSETVTVTRKSGTLVHVEVEQKSTSGVSGKLGTVAGGIGGGKSTERHRRRVLAFDLGQPEGKAAFEMFRASGVVPRVGAKEIEVGTGEQQSTTSSVSLGPASFSDASSVVSSTTIDASGKKEAHTGARAQSISLPFLGSHTKVAGFHAVERDDKDRTYRATAMVDSAYAIDASEALADATGTHTHREASGPGSGTWNISAEFSDEEVERLIGLIRKDKVVYAGLGRHYKKGESLRRAVLAAKDNHDGIREALSVFVAETGTGGLAVMRKALATNPSYDVELLGDKYLTGEKVRLEIETKASDFEARAEGPGASLGKLMAEIDQVIAYHRERADSIANHRNYPELPHQLRAAEVHRSREAVARFTQQRTRVAARLRTDHETKARETEGSTSAEQSFVEPAEAVSGGVVAGKECVSASPEVASRTKAWTELAAAKAHLDSKVIPTMERAFAEVRRRHWVHSGKWARVAPRERLGFSNLFGAGKHADDYAQAEGRLEFGKFQLLTLTGQRNALLQRFEGLERANLSGVPSTAAAVEDLRNRFQRLVPGYVLATLAFHGATAVYRRIEAANPTLVLWEPPQEMPDAYLR